MANSYRLLLEAQIDPKSLDSQIKAISTKNTILLNVKFNPNDLATLNSQLDKIKASGGQLQKVTTIGDDLGRINSAAVEYLDTNKNIVRTMIEINNQAGTTVKTTENMAAQANEFSKALLNAEKFLAKSANMTQTGTVATATGTAQQLKAAVAEGDIAKVRQLNDQLALDKAAIVSVNSGWTNFTETLKNNVKTMAQTALGIGLVMGALNQIKEGIQYIKDLNKELTNIRLVTGDTEENTAKLAVGYNNLAKEMGTTTIEVAKGSLEYIRQGKSAEETGILIRNSMMMAKLGNMEAADATERMTSMMNGFKIDAKDTGTIVDKLVALDNSYATSVDEISTAMKYSSNSAKQAGIDFDHLAAYITVVSSTTRMSAETIGQAFKTMTARMQDIKTGKLDEDGLGINNVEDALARVGIKLRKSKTEFKDMQEVIAELGTKWAGLNQVEQDNIAKSVAGIRQREIFLTLMNNQVKVQQALNVEANADGLAKQRYAIYLQSIEAAQNKLTASWEQMVSGAATKEFITSFYDGATAILDTVNALGGIPAILRIAIPLLIAFNLEWLTTQRIAAGNAISSIVSVFKNLITILPVANAGMAETALMEGEVATGFNAIALSEAGATLGLGALVIALYAGIDTIYEFKKAQDSILDNYKKEDESLQNTTESYAQYVNKTKAAANAAGYFFDAQGKMYKEGYHGAKVYVDGVNLMSEAMYKANKAGDAFDKTFKRDAVDMLDTGGYTGDATNAFKDFATTVKDLGTAFDDTDNFLKDYAKNGLKLSEISKVPTEYLDALTVEGDHLKINTDLVKEKQLATVKASLESIKAAEVEGNATAQQVAVIQGAYDQLLAENQHTFGAFHQTASDYDALLWKIANDASSAGYTFKDMAGKALNSAQSIYDYMSQGDAQFNNFVVQAANATGKSVQQIMTMINDMISHTAANVQNMTLTAMQQAATLAGSANYVQQLKSGGGKPAGGSSIGGAVLSNYTPIFTSGGEGSGLDRQADKAQAAADKKAKAKADREAKAAEAARKLEKEIEDARKAATSSLQDQLKTYKDIIDARKKILQSLDDERKYQQDIQDKNANILKLQNQLAQLSLDNSAEAQAQKLVVQDELKKAQQDLTNTQQDHSSKVQQDALDASYAAYETKVNNAIKLIEGINAKSTSDFASQLAAILAKMSAPDAVPTGAPTFHDGGIVKSYHDGGSVSGGTSLKHNEVLAKLMKGELVTTGGQAENFMKNVLPALVQGTSTNKGGDISVSMPINVQGNLDKAILPDLNRLVDATVKKLNDNLRQVGYVRRADAFSI